MKVECIKCKNPINITKGFLNVEVYGSKVFIFKCHNCKTKLRVSLQRTVLLSSINEANPNDECSFE